MITQETIRKIQDYARIEEVVGDYVHLRRAGSNMKGLCPFHDEKTPSFSVSPAKNIYKCFGCGASGDPIRFMMEHEKMTYPEALRYLAAKYRIEVEETQSTNEEKEQQSHRDSLFIAMKYAAQHYHDNLFKTEEGQNIGWSYFQSRGFSKPVAEAFQLGYAMESYDDLTSHATKAGYSLEILEQAGLIRTKEGRGAYDFFRARVMFPIHNLSGKVVAFGGRILGKDPKQPKYINTAETEIYIKGQLLYGIYQAKADIRKQDNCFLVEGYTDVLSLYQAGIPNVVASSGTALTNEQVKLIRRFTFNITLLYDGDAAGIKAALRGADIMLQEGMNVKVVLFPDGEDPDSFARKHGAEGTIEYIEKAAKDYIFFKAELLLKDAGNDPTRKAGAIRGLVESIALVSEGVKRALYTRECSKLAELPEELLVSEVNKQLAQRNRQQSDSKEKSDYAPPVEEVYVPEQPEVPVEPKLKLAAQERDLIRVLLAHGHRTMPEGYSAAAFILSELGEEPLLNELFQKTLDAFRQRFEAGEEMEAILNVHTYEDHEVRHLLIDLSTSPYELSPNWKDKHNILVKTEEEIWEADIKSILDRYTFLRIKQELELINQQLKEEGMDDEDVDILLSRHSVLHKHLKDLAKSLGTVIFK